MGNLNKYTAAVEELADKRSNFQMTNSGPDHAKVVMENIFRNTYKYVYIFAGNLNGAVSNGNYLWRLKNILQDDKRDGFFAKGASVKVILTEAPNKTSKAVSLIQKYRLQFPQRISIGILNTVSMQKVLNAFNGEIHHFTIADDCMFREETNIEEYFAIVNFNDPKKVAILKNLFLSLETTDYEPPVKEEKPLTGLRWFFSLFWKN